MCTPNTNLLLVVAKYPDPGLVKTRLGKEIGFGTAAQLYLAFLHDLAPRYLPLNEEYHLRWIYIPKNAPFPELISEILKQPLDPLLISFASYTQSGLVEQKIEQLQWAHQQGYEKVVIVPTDTPQLPQSYIAQAFQLMESYDVVLGPGTDGGYYLLGICPKHPLLQNIKMSTNHVAADILNTVYRLGLTYTLLPELLDIDEGEDLYKLARHINNCRQNPCPITWNFMQSILGIGAEGVETP
jgi:rSAM/selenodomain-associated transferase 1